MLSSDGHNLNDHIEQSFALNSVIQHRSQFFNIIGKTHKEVEYKRSLDEEIFYGKEAIKEEEFISFQELLNTNGGLIGIPELTQTDLLFYIIRYWAKQIIEIFKNLHRHRASVRFTSLNDWYVSRDGKRIKLRWLEHISMMDSHDKVTF